MGTFILESGQMIKLMERECIFIRMGRSTRDNGRKTSRMDREEKSGLMGHHSKENT